MNSWSDKTFETGQDYLAPILQFRRLSETHALPSVGEHVLVFTDGNLDDNLRFFNKATDNKETAIMTKMCIYHGLDEYGYPVFRVLNKTYGSLILSTAIVGWSPMPLVQRVTPYPDVSQPISDEIEQIIFQAPERY